MRHAAYVILPVSHPAYSHVVIATSFRNPLHDLSTVEADCAHQHLHGVILFDLLLAVGPTRQRFLAGEFSGTHFIVWASDSISSHDPLLMTQLDDFYRQHPHMLRRGVLSRHERLQLTRPQRQPAL
jgi:hypothetical protein